MSRGRERLLRHWPALALCAVSAVLAVVLKHWVFSYLSLNNDEAIYRLQADAIAHGHLFPAAPSQPEAFLPWLAVIREHHYVLHYSPVLPALMALSMLLGGGMDLYLGGIVAGAVGMAYLLSSEILGDRRRALIAATLVAASPIVVIHSALLLSYLPTLLLLQLYGWALMRGLRLKSGWLLAVSGAAIGLAFHVRPYDTILFGPPMLAIIWWRRPTWRLGAAFLAPVGCALAAFLALNHLASGRAFVPPFTLLESADRFGFGQRKLYPTAGIQTFSIFEAVEGFVAHGRLLLVWLCGGPILAVLAIAGLRKARVEALVPAVAACVVPLGYFVFWGPWNAAVLWGGTRFLGPFYFIVLLLPAAVLGARTLVTLLDRSAWQAAAIAAAMAAMAVVVSVTAVADHLDFKRQQVAVLNLVDGTGPGSKIVFTQTIAPFLQHPVANLGNNALLSGDVVYAVQRGSADLDAFRIFRDRTPFVLASGGDFTERRGVTGRIQRLRYANAPTLDFRVRVRLPRGAWVADLEVRAFGKARQYRLPYAAGSHEEGLRVSVGDAEVTSLGPVPQYVPHHQTAVRAGPQIDRGVVLTLYLARTSEDAHPQAYEGERIALRRSGRTLEALVPVGPVTLTPTARPRLLEIRAA